MTERPNNPPAFPRNYAHEGHNGMDLRDYFAGQALAGITAASSSDNYVKHLCQRALDAGVAEEEYASLMAYALADAMLAARTRASGGDDGE